MDVNMLLQGTLSLSTSRSYHSDLTAMFWGLTPFQDNFENKPQHKLMGNSDWLSLHVIDCLIRKSNNKHPNFLVMIVFFVWIWTWSHTSLAGTYVHEDSWDPSVDILSHLLCGPWSQRNPHHCTSHRHLSDKNRNILSSILSTGTSLQVYWCGCVFYVLVSTMIICTLWRNKRPQILESGAKNILLKIPAFAISCVHLLDAFREIREKVNVSDQVSTLTCSFASTPHLPTW